MLKKLYKPWLVSPPASKIAYWIIYNQTADKHLSLIVVVLNNDVVDVTTNHSLINIIKHDYGKFKNL